VLSWIAKGKTAEETATILGISRRTVEWHIQNARRKADATNITHVVARAIRCGVISIHGTGVCGIVVASALQSPSLRKIMRHAIDFEIVRTLIS
jgi:orotate phosphoribosyltransferase-like protein